MQGAADAGHILRHARENVADGRVIDKADRQALDLIGDLDAQIAGKIPADSAVEQLHLAVADGGAQKIYAEQRQQPRRKLRQHGRARLRRVEIVDQDLHQRAHLRRDDERAHDEHQAHDHAERKLPANGLRALQQLDERVGGNVGLLFLLHFASPPVCEA